MSLTPSPPAAERCARHMPARSRCSWLAAAGSSQAASQPSLVTIDIQPAADDRADSPSQSHTPGLDPDAQLAGRLGTSFCTAFADLTVAHQLAIDIERAIADNSRSDAQGLAKELAQTAPLANNEVTRLKEWAPADQVKTDMSAMLDLDNQVSQRIRKLLQRQRQSQRSSKLASCATRSSKAVDPANTQLAQLADLGSAAPARPSRSRSSDHANGRPTTAAAARRRSCSRTSRARPACCSPRRPVPALLDSAPGLIRDAVEHAGGRVFGTEGDARVQRRFRRRHLV